MNSPTGTSESIRIECSASESFQAWLAQAGGSLAVSTYQAGKVAMIGWDGRQIRLLMRQFDKPLGLAVAGKRMVLSTRHEVWVFANSTALAPGYLEDQPGRYDALYLPRVTYHTGDLNTHDVAFEGDDVILVATRFSCLARLSRDFNFAPVWKPDFITELVPEDRCHLNGLAMRDGRARYVTALGVTDSPGEWRQNKAAGGVLIDVESGDILVDGMAMPHSPRWYGEKLWVLNSGAGELLRVDPDSGQREVVCELPGYLRGLCFAGPYAMVGLCKIREKHIFGGLPIQEKQEKLLCGVAVVDTRSGRQVGLFEYTVGCEEIYDVQFLPGVFRPTILNLEKEATRQAITSRECSFWLRASNEIREGRQTAARASGDSVPPPPAGPAVEQAQYLGNSLPDSGNRF